MCEIVCSHAFMVWSDVLLHFEQLLNTFTCASITVCTRDNIYMTSVPTRGQWKLFVSCVLISSSKQTLGVVLCEFMKLLSYIGT